MFIRVAIIQKWESWEENIMHCKYKGYHIENLYILLYISLHVVTSSLENHQAPLSCSYKGGCIHTSKGWSLTFSKKMMITQIVEDAQETYSNTLRHMSIIILLPTPTISTCFLTAFPAKKKLFTFLMLQLPP